MTAAHVGAYKAMTNLEDAERLEEEKRKKQSWLAISAAVEVPDADWTQ